jgi:hypothetical protein
MKQFVYYFERTEKMAHSQYELASAGGDIQLGHL